MTKSDISSKWAVIGLIPEWLCGNSTRFVERGTSLYCSPPSKFLTIGEIAHGEFCFIQSFGGLSIGTTMTSRAKLAHWASTLELASLTTALEPGLSVDGLPLAAALAHDPDPRLQEAVIRLLSRHGANVNETDKNGVTPLHRAVRVSQPRCG